MTRTSQSRIRTSYCRICGKRMQKAKLWIIALCAKCRKELGEFGDGK
jgi:hypothetical protein